MKFTKMVAILAILASAASASATSDGTLRRNSQVAQNDVVTETSTKEVNININTQPQQAAQQQPTTVVEAQPVVESKAEGMRRARQEAEVSTEQKIVEKLEDSRLQEEKARADRLFGNKMDAPPAAAAVVVAPQPAPAPAPAPVAQPVIVQEKPAPPAQVTIEKVEIIQPAARQEPQAEPVAQSRADNRREEEAPEKTTKYYVSALLGNLSYQASNVKSNYGLGVAVGTILNDRIAVELSYMYSNHNVLDLWGNPIYHNLDQTDVSAAAKYYILSGKLKPYVGGSLSYINRKYTDRVYPNYGYGYGYYGYGNTSTTESTQAIDAGLLTGVDFAISDSFMIGAGVDYNFNVMNMTSFDQRAYNLPSGSQELEKISFYTIKVTGKLVF